jgi:uncharacterized Zn finger protein
MAWYGEFPAYVSVAERQAKAAKAVAKLKKKGRVLAPAVVTAKRGIAESFWGRAWCDNLEDYSDFESRLPRGRSYARNGSVIDLQIRAGQVTALVQGSAMYEITIAIRPLAKTAWARVRQRCTGKLGTLVELLQGKLSGEVMAVMTEKSHGLFPAPKEITMDCSCPDGAAMCKHVAAALYGVGARLDREPHLLFVLRQVDHTSLLDVAATKQLKAGKAKRKTIAASALGDVFGIAMSEAPPRSRDPHRRARLLRHT